VSGHLQRLAARSVGSPSASASAARPRLSARFEPSVRDSGSGTAGFDEPAAGMAAPPAPAPGSEAAADGGRRQATPSPTPADGARGAPRPATRGRSAAGPAPASPPVAPAPASTANPHPPAAQPSAAEAAPARPASADERPAPQRRTPVATTARVAARPAAQGRPAPAPDRREPAVPPAVAEAPVVRVHIGRLEVRANLQPAPASAPAPARSEPAPEELGLSAYLRGERAAR
jgi:hypothetical protein